MDEQVDRLVQKVWTQYKDLRPSQRLMIAVSGIPGSGKTTLAAKVVEGINKEYAQSSPGIAAGGNTIAACIPMDGYHLTRTQLSALPSPHTAHARRGASFTFDASSLLSLVRALRAPLAPESKTLYAPSFDHKVKDPVPDDIPISPGARVLLFEGNYLSLGTGVWGEVAGEMDELWFVEVDFETARERLVKRHVKAGIAADEEAAHKRVTENDLVNGKEIVDGKLDVHEVIVSKEDTGWKGE